MKRKLVSQGHSAITLTLPKKWCDRHSLKPGSEIELLEDGNKLVIKGEDELQGGAIQIETSGLSDRTIKLLISSLHRGGFSEITFQYSESETLKLILEMVKDILLGFAVVRQGDNFVVLRSIARESPEEFTQILRRAFLVTESMGISMVEMIEKRKYSELKDLIALEKTNNQLTSFCQRILNRHGHPEWRKTCFYYVIAWNLEKVCDDYKYMCNILSKAQPKDNMAITGYIKNANTVFKSFHEAFYNFDVEKLDSIHLKNKALMKDIVSAIKDNPDKEVLMHLHHMLMKIDDFMASTIAINCL